MHARTRARTRALTHASAHVHRTYKGTKTALTIKKMLAFCLPKNMIVPYAHRAGGDRSIRTKAQWYEDVGTDVAPIVGRIVEALRMDTHLLSRFVVTITDNAQSDGRTDRQTLL